LNVAFQLFSLGTPDTSNADNTEVKTKEEKKEQEERNKNEFI
jgi:hypothetical protein